MLLAPTGWAFAHPGHGHGHAKVHHRHAQQHKWHGNHGHGHPDGSRDDGDNQPAVSGQTDASGTPNKASVRNAGHHGRGYGHADRAALASHPGRALGLFKHASGPIPHVVHRHHSSPPTLRPPPSTAPPSTPVGNAPDQPARHQPVRHHPAPPTGQPGQPQTGPGGQQHTTQPPPVGKHHDAPSTLAQLLLRSNTERFTALPLLIVSVLALCVGGLVHLARHRA
jgi:hypothetical protein